MSYGLSPVNDERAKCKTAETWRRVAELNKVFLYCTGGRTDREWFQLLNMAWNINISDRCQEFAASCHPSPSAINTCQRWVSYLFARLAFLLICWEHTIIDSHFVETNTSTVHSCTRVFTLFCHKLKHNSSKTSYTFFFFHIWILISGVFQNCQHSGR